MPLCICSSALPPCDVKDFSPFYQGKNQVLSVPSREDVNQRLVVFLTSSAPSSWPLLTSECSYAVYLGVHPYYRMEITTAAALST